MAKDGPAGAVEATEEKTAPEGQGGEPPSGEEEERERRRAPGDQKERKQRLLTQGAPSMTEGIAEAVVVKDGDVFFLSAPDGRVPLRKGHGLGLYHRDTRYLDGYEMRVAGTRLNALVSNAERGFAAVTQLTNPDLQLDGRVIRKESLGVRWDRVADGEGLALHDRITFRSFDRERIAFPVELAFRASFEDVFAIRGLLAEQRGTCRPPCWEGGVLVFDYDGADGLTRRLCIRFQPDPAETGDDWARFQLELGCHETDRIELCLAVSEGRDLEPPEGRRPAPERATEILRRAQDEWIEGHTRMESNSLVVNDVLERSLRDLRVLRSYHEGKRYFSAGIPWFATLFGRDSLITALQTLAFDPDNAEQTLRLLADHQGDRVDAWRDEQPGKILHELRAGEMARLGEIPHTPYFGTVDATPLFLVLLARHAGWTGRLDVFRDLRGNVDRALHWMDEYGALKDGGYIDYESSSEEGLANQGWKDSGDAIVRADGELAEPPIALVEVQGYAYLAKSAIAELFERDGKPEWAERLRREAEELRERFETDFWLEDKGTYALALQKDGSPAAVVSSNPGHALWAGIASPDRAARVVESLMSDGMWSGWGVRTLSAEERAFNPVGYHLGTVWPHDNAFIAAGFRAYGFDHEALRIFDGMVEAALQFRYRQLPELFAGFRKQDYGVPVHYPVACHPQAWAAGSFPFLLQTILGLQPEAFENRLRIVRPRLPDSIDRLTVRDLRVGQATVQLWFERTTRGVAVQVLDLDGDLHVQVEP